MTSDIEETEELTPEPEFDMNSLIAQVEEGLDEEAPEDPDESTEDVGEDSGPEETEGELEADEDADDSVPVVEEEPEDEEETTEPVVDPPAEEDPEDNELQRLKEALEASHGREQQYFDMLQMNAQAKPEPKSKDLQVPDRAIHLAMYGTASEQSEWNKYSADVRQEATRIAQDYAAREAKYVKQPDLRYEEQYREKVMADLFKVLEPVLQDYHNRKAESVFQKHAPDGMGEADKKRLTEIYSKVPGSQSSDWQAQEQALSFAVQMLNMEKERETLNQQKRKVVSKEKQQKAAKRASRRGSKGSQGRRGKGKREPWRPGVPLDEYARNLEETGEM